MFVPMVYPHPRYICWWSKVFLYFDIGWRRLHYYVRIAIIDVITTLFFQKFTYGIWEVMGLYGYGIRQVRLYTKLRIWYDDVRARCPWWTFKILILCTKVNPDPNVDLNDANFLCLFLLLLPHVFGIFSICDITWFRIRLPIRRHLRLLLFDVGGIFGRFGIEDMAFYIFIDVFWGTKRVSSQILHFR